MVKITLNLRVSQVVTVAIALAQYARRNPNMQQHVDSIYKAIEEETNG